MKQDRHLEWDVASDFGEGNVLVSNQGALTTSAYVSVWVISRNSIITLNSTLPGTAFTPIVFQYSVLYLACHCSLFVSWRRESFQSGHNVAVLRSLRSWLRYSTCVYYIATCQHLMTNHFLAVPRAQVNQPFCQ